MKSFYQKAAVVLAMAGIACSMTAKNIYAKPGASANAAGTEQTPCSLDAAIKKLAAKDSLFLMGGTYMLNSTITFRTAGTEQNRTFIGAYKDEKPVLDFRNQPHGKNGVSVKGDYIHMKGIAVCYAGYKGIFNEASHCIMENLDVYGNCDSGIQHKKGVNNLILNCDSHDNFDYETGTIYAADWGGNADGFADKQFTNSPGNTYIGCRSWNNSDDGWDFYQRVGGTTIMKNCICYAMGPKEYDLRNHPRRQTDKNFLDQFDGNGIDITLKNNKGTVHCSLEHFYNNGNANGFKLGGDYTKHDVTLYRCLAVGNNERGFDQNNNQGEMRIYNGTAYLNNQNYGFYSDKGYSLDIKNCVSLDSEKDDTFRGSKITEQNNTWSKGFSVSQSNFQNTDTTLIVSPRKPDGSLPDTPFMRLAPTSRLIDSGTIVEGIEYSGSAPDLGCYEYSGTSSVSTANILSSEDEITARYGADGTAIPLNRNKGLTIVKTQSGKAAAVINRKK